MAFNLGTSFYGWDGSKVVGNVCHRGPTLVVSGTASFTRSSATSKYIDYEVNVTVSNPNGKYGYIYSLAIIQGGTRNYVTNTYSSYTGTGYYISNGTTWKEEDINPTSDGTSAKRPLYNSGTSVTRKITGSYECTNNNTIIDVVLWCNDGDNVNSDGNVHNCHSDNWGFANVSVGSINTSSLTNYVPYQRPTVSISAYNGDTIARADGTSLDSQLQRVSITTSNSDGYTSTTRLTINGNAKDATYGNGTQTGEFYPAKYKVGNYSSYTVVANTVHDKKSDYTASASITLYTYTPPQDPNVQLNLNGDKYATISNVKTISPHDGASVSFKIGSRGWNDDNIEKPFTTEFKCNSYVNNDYKIANNGNNIQTTTHTVNLNATNLNNMLTVAERSTARVSTTVYVKNINPSANWSDDGSVTFNVQYQPRLAPTEGDVKYGGTSYKGQTVLVTDVPKITVNWSYDSSKGASGVVNGYLYTVYADSSKNKVMKTDRISGTSVDINTSELNLGTLNYIVVTPYYTKADGTGYIDGSLSVGFNLIKPLNKLLKPEIEYPQKDYSIDAKTTTAYWHNKNFRVCFISSQDPDLDNIIAKEKITPETYEYNNIQVMINSKIYSYNDHSAMFSRNKTGHLHHFVINPSLISSFANESPAEYYNIQVRFQKKYYADLNSEDSWSDWSNQIRITMHSLPAQTFTAGQEIKAVHLDTIKQHIIHAYNAYSSSNASYSATQVGQSIAHATFKTYYDYIQAIKTTVNSYGAFTRDSVKFDKDNKIDTIDAFKKEFITANKEVTYADESTGSNYFKLLEESLKNLK